VITRSALFREESRGVHYRQDFPKKDKNWLANINAKSEKGEIKIFKTPLVLNKNHPLKPEG
jgi:succinate dehydrogenase/fumarate reductase flavoprotein subunit